MRENGESMGHISVPSFGKKRIIFFQFLAPFEKKNGRVDGNLPAGVCSQSTPLVEEVEQGTHLTSLCISNYSQESQRVASPLIFTFLPLSPIGKFCLSRWRNCPQMSQLKSRGLSSAPPETAAPAQCRK